MRVLPWSCLPSCNQVQIAHPPETGGDCPHPPPDVCNDGRRLRPRVRVLWVAAWWGPF